MSIGSRAHILKPTKMTLNFSQNLTNPQVVQCYNVSSDFEAKNNTCESYTSCSEIRILSQINKTSEDESVIIAEGRGTAEIIVDVPTACNCSAVVVKSSPTHFLTAVIVSSVVLVIVIVVGIIVFVGVVLACKNMTKQTKGYVTIE